MQTNVSYFGLPNTRRQFCNHILSRTGPGQTRLKLYTLFRTEGPKTIPYPAARPRIAHIGEYPPTPRARNAPRGEAAVFAGYVRLKFEKLYQKSKQLRECRRNQIKL